MSELTNVEALLLSQAVWESGTDAWHAVAQLLANHSLLSRPPDFFAPAACHAMYTRLLADASLISSSHAAHAPENLRLAQIFYKRRLEELRSLIAAEESKFKSILAEIEEIRSGSWNDQPAMASADVAMDDQSGDTQQDVYAAAEADPVADANTSEHATLDAQSVEEFRQAHRQEEEEEEEEEREVIRPEEEEAEQELEPEPIPITTETVASPQAEEVKDDTDDVQPTHVADTQTLEIEQGDATTNDEEPQPSVRRSRRHRASTSTAPPVQPKGTRARRSTRLSEAAETSPIPADDEHELNPVTENAPEEMEHDQIFSPAVDDSGSQRIDGKRRAVLQLNQYYPYNPVKRKVSLIDTLESPRERKRQRDESEPVDEDEPGPSSATVRGKRRGDKTEGQVALKRFQNVIGMLHSQISQHRNGNIFHNPIKNSDAPDYHEIVKRPIDLKTIKAKVRDGHIANSLEYQRDIYLMFANAMVYNVPGSDVYAMAEDMMLESEGHISSFRQTEGLVRRL
ncbi:hypothetical protein APHAL10511_001885 [Amanita phalloides]|nr:hypothetical protein APHAL10511_001885 [Amanita phalloides]